MAINPNDKALQSLVKMTAEKTAWKNASPGSAFPGQTIDVPGLQQYEKVCIKGSYSTGAYPSFYFETSADVGSTASISIAASAIATRAVTIGTNEITFGSGERVMSYGGSVEQNNAVSIPLEITLKRKKP